MSVGDVCAYSMDASRAYLALGCPSYLATKGKVQVYSHLNSSMLELYSFEGDGDMFSVGENLQIVEENP